MAKSKFNLAEKLGGVSNLNTPDMQVVQIPLSQLIVNEHNFFTVEDVQELADHIALHGLFNPLTGRGGQVSHRRWTPPPQGT